MVYKNTGYSVEYELPNDYNGSRYNLIIQYTYDRTIDMFKLVLSVRKFGDNKAFFLKEDKYITSTKDTIKHDICVMVEAMIKDNEIDPFIMECEKELVNLSLGADVMEVFKKQFDVRFE